MEKRMSMSTIGGLIRGHGFCFMVWIAYRLSESATLPTFIFPKKIKDRKLNLTNVMVGDLKKGGVR